MGWLAGVGMKRACLQRVLLAFSRNADAPGVLASSVRVTHAADSFLDIRGADCRRIFDSFTKPSRR